MKTHLINYIARIGLLMMVLTGGWKTGWGQYYPFINPSGGYHTYTSNATINLTGNVTMKEFITVDGCTLTINANGANRTLTRRPYQMNDGNLFEVINGGKLVIKGTSSCKITLDGAGYIPTDNFGGAAIDVVDGTVELEYVEIKGCRNQIVSGGTVYNYMTGGGIAAETSTIKLQDVTFTDNIAQSGGALGVMGCTVTMNHCTLQNIVADYGGALYFDADVAPCSVTIENNTTFKSNTGARQGGAIWAEGELSLKNSSIVNNTCAGQGGGIYAQNSSRNTIITIDNSSINENTSSTYGGGIMAKGGSYETIVHIGVNGSSSGHVNSNSAALGGGVFLMQQGGSDAYDPVVYVYDNSTISNNTAQQAGGVFINKGTLNLIGSNAQINSNNATTDIGGVYIVANGSMTVNGGQVSGNTSAGSCGGIHKRGPLTVSGEVVIANNQGTYTATPTRSNVFIHSNADEKYINIGSASLDCGSSIGVTKTNDFTGTAPSDYTVIATGTSANCLEAFNNHYFFDDGSTYGVYTSSTSPYATTNLYFFGTGISNGWSRYADAAGCTISGGYVTHVNTAAGLAYLAKDIASGKNYSGKTVLLTADLNMAGHNWEPIGSTTSCSDRAFAGTFNGQGHTITGLSSNLPYDNMGLFGYVTGTVKNLVVASSSITSSATNLGGIVGELNGGSVYNCISTVTLSGPTYRGALVGKVTSGSVKNSFAVSNDAVVGSGTATNCYVRKASGGTAANMGTATNTGASGTTSGAFTQTVTPYLYRHDDNKVGSTALLTLLNDWVDAQTTPADLAHWTRTCASPINGDYPLLMMPGAICVGSNDNTTLQYRSSLNTMMTDITDVAGHNIFLYDNATGVTADNTNRGVYIAEDVAINHTSAIANAHVGITIDPTNGSEGVHWHMFSPALGNAPLGINYTDNTDWPFSLTHPSGMPYYLFTQKSESNATYGYFPSHNYGDSYPANDNNLTDAGNAGNYYTHWDFYTYYEPEYHWINFKRNGNSHHHEDEDPSHPHIDYHWDNNTSNSASLNINEPTLVRGKGYLVATDHECFLEAKGTLNQGTFTIPVTTQGDYRTGYNLLGNPYQSYFDFDKFADENKALWGGTKTNASYIILNKDGYTYYAYSGSDNLITSSAANRYLHPHQGFMIVATNAGTASFTNDMRNTTATTPFREDHINYPLVNLIVTEADGNRDIATIEMGRPEVGGALKQYDLHLGKGQIYTHYEDRDYAIAFTQPGIDEVPVRFETDEDATYTLTWDMENGEFHYLHLIDNLTGIDIDCLTTTEYRFKAKASDYKSRFKLVFGYTGIEDDASASSETFAFIMGNELVVNGEGYFQMFDLAGRLVMTETMSGTQTTAVLPDVPTGVYVIRLTNKKGTRVQKMVIEN